MEYEVLYDDSIESLVLYDDSIESLVKQVYEYINEGWKPQGSITEAHAEGMFKEYYGYIQVMIKEVSKVNEGKTYADLNMPEGTKDINVSNKKLTSLEGAPEKVKGNFDCNGNKLTSLEGSPEEVGGGFWCSYNNLTSLEGASEEVGGNFNCSYNKLTSLEGSPEKVGVNFYCSYNKLTSLEGSPKEVGGDFWCKDNETRFTEEEVRAVCEVKGNVYV